MSACAILHHPGEFAARSGLNPLVEAVGARPVYYDRSWQRLEKISWRLSHAVRKAGVWYYGSAWNWILPVLDERRLSREIARGEEPIVHFLWGEFASPRHPKWFRDGARKLIGTFHASARRQPKVMSDRFRLDVYDAITVMSATQVPYFVERGFPAGRVKVILHGVDTRHFSPGPAPANDGPLRLLLVGSTERDHEFAAAVMSRMSSRVARLDVATVPEQISNYRNTEGVNLLPRLNDAQLVAAYRQADLLFMPMNDCTANNAILEAMACGTPVIANRVGGIPEYVDASCNYVMADKQVDDWIGKLTELSSRREELGSRRSAVRAWAERFDWSVVAPHYLALYRSLAS